MSTDHDQADAARGRELLATLEQIAREDTEGPNADYEYDIRRANTRCEWFLMCTNRATGVMPHPILGDVPICDRCRNLATDQRK